MPELPEVETVRRGLAPHITGRQIVRLQLNRADLRVPFPPDIVQIATGATITDVTRRAKYLLLHLNNRKILIIHLGMSGQLVLMDEADYQPKKHDHVLMTLDNSRYLVFRDPRRFGLWAVAGHNDWQNHSLFAHLGPEPLENGFNEAYLTHKLAKRSSSIKTTLMDQALVVGVGNIYVCEALFRSRVHPAVEANKSIKYSDIMIKSIRSVLLEAIESGGSTLRDYVRSSGDSGYFQHQFQVYGREGEPCVVCATPISRLVQSGRSTFFCQQCQMVMV